MDHLIDPTLEGTPEISPMSGPATVRLPDSCARPTEPLPDLSPARTLPLPDTSELERTLRLEEMPDLGGAPAFAYVDPLVAHLAASAGVSLACSVHPMPGPLASPARMSSHPPPASTRAKVQLRVFLPLCAAFLTLGVVLGLLLVFPVLR